MLLRIKKKKKKSAEAGQRSQEQCTSESLGNSNSVFMILVTMHKVGSKIIWLQTSLEMGTSLGTTAVFLPHFITKTAVNTSSLKGK